MSRSFWIGGMALLLLSAPPARADGTTELQVGPVRLKVQAEAQPLQYQPVQVDVQVKKRPGAAIQVQAGPGRGENQVIVIAGPTEIKLGEYWLGLGCTAAPAALRAQLDLPEDQGLVVDQVVPDGPAAKAEIQQHDVLVKAGDKPLKNVQDLIDAVQSAKEKDLSIELIHRGKRKEVTVTPTKRPEQAQPGLTPHEAFKKWLEGLHRPGTELDDATKRALEYLERMQQGEALKGPLRWRFFGPGAVLPPEPPPPLPGNVSITITRQGNQPAKVTVKQGDQKWEVTEEELDKLPEEIRPHVERMLGRVVGGSKDRVFRFDLIPDRGGTQPSASEGRLEKRLEEMNRRIERLRKSIEELQQKRPRLKEAPEETPDEV
jgi:hypothetical protein